MIEFALTVLAIYIICKLIGFVLRVIFMLFGFVMLEQVKQERLDKRNKV